MKYFRWGAFVVISVVCVLVALVFGFVVFAGINSRVADPFSNALPAVAIIVLVAGGGVALGAKLLGMRRARRWGIAAGLVAAAVPLGTAAVMWVVDVSAPKPPPTSRDVVEALREQTHVLVSVDAGSGFEDLEPLRAALADRRVVALGEATHGTSEFFRMKHRLVEYLVTELGFRDFAMETNWTHVAPLLNDYIQGRDVDPEAILYWPWATREYMDLLQWMRGYNAVRDSLDRITFHGIDPQQGARDSVMAVNVAALIDGDAARRVIVWAANSHVRGALNAMGQYLREGFGDDVYLLGLEFHRGSFTSRMKGIQTYEAGPFPPEYYSHALAELQGPARFLDFETMSARPELHEWLTTPRVTNHLFELYAVTRYYRAATRVRLPWPDLFDGVVFIENSTPASTLTRRQL